MYPNLLRLQRNATTGAACVCLQSRAFSILFDAHAHCVCGEERKERGERTPVGRWRRFAPNACVSLALARTGGGLLVACASETAIVWRIILRFACTHERRTPHRQTVSARMCIGVCVILRVLCVAFVVFASLRDDVGFGFGSVCGLVVDFVRTTKKKPAYSPPAFCARFDEQQDSRRVPGERNAHHTQSLLSSRAADQRLTIIIIFGRRLCAIAVPTTQIVRANSWPWHQQQHHQHQHHCRLVSLVKKKHLQQQHLQQHSNSSIKMSANVSKSPPTTFYVPAAGFLIECLFLRPRITQHEMCTRQ